jgi:octaprenyl-diphosphate synthase
MTSTYLEAARELAGGLADDLALDVRRAEVVLESSLSSDVERVEAIGRHVSDAGGKRLRPLFVALAARATGNAYNAQRVAALGACMEMIHMATLIHDDVVDNADTRRGRPTACSLHGNTAGILCGDVLLARAMELLAIDGDLEIIRMVSKAVVEMATGEVMEVDSRGVFDLDEDRHLEILRRKTASFIAACCKAGAMAAIADEQATAALAAYGEAIGMGFQIADDLLDFQSPTDTSGKPRATDFREGCATLPLIYLRAYLTHDESAYVQSKFGNGVADADINRIATWMEERESYARALAKAEGYAEQARRALDELPEGPARDLLSTMATLLISRSA